MVAMMKYLHPYFLYVGMSHHARPQAALRPSAGTKLVNTVIFALFLRGRNSINVGIAITVIPPIPKLPKHRRLTRTAYEGEKASAIPKTPMMVSVIAYGQTRPKWSVRKPIVMAPSQLGMVVMAGKRAYSKLERPQSFWMSAAMNMKEEMSKP